MFVAVKSGAVVPAGRCSRKQPRPITSAVLLAGMAGAVLGGTSCRTQAQVIGSGPSNAQHDRTGTSPSGPIGTPETVQPSPPQNVSNDIAPPPTKSIPRVSLGGDFIPVDTGKGPKTGAYYLNRDEEDFSYLRDPSKHNDIFDPLKFIRLNDAGTAYLTISGEERIRTENFTKNNLIVSKPEHNEIVQFRSQYGLDLHVNDYVRGFVQLENGALGGHNYGQPSPIGRNDLALLQAFGELSFPVGDGKVGVRIGRQELWLGSGVLISTREGGNTQSTLDGFRGYYDNGKLRVDAFAFDNVTNHYGVLDDATNAHQQYWGLYATQALPDFQLAGAGGRLFIDPFYLGDYFRHTTFANVVGNDGRYMVGGRLWGQIGASDLDVTGAYQGGSTGSEDVSAYALFASGGYTFDAPGAPRLAMRFTLASGGRDGPTVANAHTGSALHTFNPLLPAPGPFGEALLIAPVNLIEVSPGVSFSPTQKLRVYVYTLFGWKYAERDGIYSSALTQYRNTLTAPGRFIGIQPAVRASYSVNQHLTVSGALAFLDIGPALRNAHSKNNAYSLLQTSLKF